MLILGNGVSRLKHIDFVSQWEDELWVCNAAYQDFAGFENLTRVATDNNLVSEIVKFKKQKKLKFKILVNQLLYDSHENRSLTPFSIPLNLQNDSGTSLVAQALTEPFDQIYVAGFDLGGKDIYVENHDKKRKDSWVLNWRVLSSTFGIEKVFFLGKDHKPFIYSTKPADTYSKQYMHGEAHVDWPTKEEKDMTEPAKKIEIDRSNQVLILGNGTSRLTQIDFIKEWEGEIWVCNWAFKESLGLPRLDRVGSVHENVVKQAIKFREAQGVSYQIYSSKPFDGVTVFTDVKGWSTGSLMLQQALIEKFSCIVLLGFDMGGADIYQDHILHGNNFKNQYNEIKRNYGMDSVFFLRDRLIPAGEVFYD